MVRVGRYGPYLQRQLPEATEEEIPEDDPGVRPAEDPSRAFAQLDQDQDTDALSDSGTNRTGDDVEAFADAPVAGKDELQRAVEEKVAAVEAAAGSEPVVNAPPAKKAAKRAATKKAAPAKATTAKATRPTARRR